MSNYQIFLSLHIIGFVSWFAGQFYYVRLIIYYQETVEKELSREVKQSLLKQFVLMAKRLRSIIIFPAMIFTWINGIGLIVVTKSYLYGWFHFKFLFLILLTLYTFFGNILLKSITHHKLKPLKIFSSFNLRLFNELATVFLIVIVSMAVFKDVGIGLIFSLSVIGIIILIFFFILLTKKILAKLT